MLSCVRKLLCLLLGHHEYRWPGSGVWGVYLCRRCNSIARVHTPDGSALRGVVWYDDNNE